MRDETTKGTCNRQTAALISHDLTRNNKLAFSSTRNLQFYRFQILKFFFLDFGFGIPKKTDVNDIYGKAMLNQGDRISQSDTARQRLRARKNEPITSNVPLCLFHSSKGRASWL